MPPDYTNTSLLILCGGGSRRMQGEDKGLMEYAGNTMIGHILQRLAAPFSQVLISSNRNLQRYREFGYTVIADAAAELGPLGGIQAAIQRTDRPFLLVSACDTPLVTTALSKRLFAAAQHHHASVYLAHDGARAQLLHALFALGDTRLAASLHNYLESQRSVQGWYAQLDTIEVDCADIAREFTNINTPAQLHQLQATGKRQD